MVCLVTPVIRRSPGPSSRSMIVQRMLAAIVFPERTDPERMLYRARSRVITSNCLGGKRVNCIAFLRVRCLFPLDRVPAFLDHPTHFVQLSQLVLLLLPAVYLL